MATWGKMATLKNFVKIFIIIAYLHNKCSQYYIFITQATILDNFEFPILSQKKIIEGGSPGKFLNLFLLKNKLFLNIHIFVNNNALPIILCILVVYDILNLSSSWIFAFFAYFFFKLIFLYDSAQVGQNGHPQFPYVLIQNAEKCRKHKNRRQIAKN